MKKVGVVCMLFIGLSVMAQEQVKPTELEQAQLDTLKAQNETYVAQLSQIDTQIQALNILRQLTSEHQQQKYSQYLGKADDVKKAHKEWGDSDKVIFNPQQEIFTKQPEKKDTTQPKK